MTANSDIWNSGVLLYELITGRQSVDGYRTTARGPAEAAGLCEALSSPTPTYQAVDEAGQSTEPEPLPY